MDPTQALMHEWILEGLPPKVLIQHKKMLGIEEFIAPMEDENKTQNLIENLLAFSGDGNKSHRSHRRKVSNHLSREFSNEMKESKDSNNSKPRVPINNWMDNPYQDIMEISKKPGPVNRQKQYFAHTDNNLKGISNLTKDEDLMM